MNALFKKLSMRAAALTLGGAMLLPAVSAFAATPYTATDNDTFWSLSKKFDVPLKRLMELNPNVDPMNIYAGLTLSIPASASRGHVLKAKSDDAPDILSANSVLAPSGKSLSYSKVVTMKATAYSAAPEENGWGAVDYFGNPLKLGTIAVDPKVIPLGTKVFITGYDFDGLPDGGMIATATDEGSAIVGDRIDIFVPGSRQKVSEFGFQNVKLYVLK